MEELPTVVVVDDDELQTKLVGRWLSQDGYNVECRHSATACLDYLATAIPDVALLDVHMPKVDGLALLAQIKERYPYLPVVMLTSETEVESVVQAMQAGAYDYLVKPVQRARLLAVMSHARDYQTMAINARSFVREQRSSSDDAGMISESEAMRPVLRQLDRLMASDVTVLLHGESGTGKELAARAIHDGSGRARGPFVAVNCAAIPESLQESELFGHEKGAFTGASERRIGRFEEADGGTLFLDEVAELAPRTQGALLRVLQERTFRRVGGASDQRSDFRLVAASHKRIEDLVGEGSFRQDLYYRLAVFELDLPALRERPEDIPVLARRFASDAAREEGLERLVFSEEAMHAILAYGWPGNVRELKNAIRRAAVLVEDATIRLEDLPRPLQTDEAGSPMSAGDIPLIPLAELEERAIRRAYEHTGRNVSETGRLLGISRATLYRKLGAYGLLDGTES